MDILKSATIFLQGSIKTDKKKTLVVPKSLPFISFLLLILDAKNWKNV